MLFPEITHLVLVFVLQLGRLIIEILLLGLNNHMQLSLLSFDLLNELLKVSYLFKVLDFLRSNLLVKHVLLLLMTDLVLKINSRVYRYVFLIDLVFLSFLDWAAKGNTSTETRTEGDNVIFIQM